MINPNVYNRKDYGPLERGPVLFAFYLSLMALDKAPFVNFKFFYIICQQYLNNFPN